MPDFFVYTYLSFFFFYLFFFFFLPECSITFDDLSLMKIDLYAGQTTTLGYWKLGHLTLLILTQNVCKRAIDR